MKLLKALVLLAAVALSPQTAGAVVIGQIDTFQTGIDNWFAGGLGFGQVPPIPPQIVSTGGPGGAGDAFLKITALGGSGGPGSKLTAINTTQWTGNYLAAGVGAIAMDLRNLGATDLTVRLLFEDPMGGPGADEAVTSFGLLLPAGGSWTHAVFPVAVPDLTVLHGSATTLLSQVLLLRIIHNPIADEAVPVVGTLGVDNITAAVPEPSSLALLISASLAGLVSYRRRRGGSRKDRG